MPLLEKVPHLNNSQVTKLIQSIEINDQVEYATRIPERIRTLVSRLAAQPAK